MVRVSARGSAKTKGYPTATEHISPNRHIAVPPVARVQVERGLTVDLADWNSRLFAELVADGQEDERLYLYVDRGVLAQVSGLDEESAIKDFCAPFQTKTGRSPFHVALEQGIAWKRAGWAGEPPCVAALCMTVLAVTEDPIGNSNGVYRRQNELLGLPAEARAPDGYQCVPMLWQLWNEWLCGPGAQHGRPSAQAHERWVLQGWPRSQGLIRFNDRLLIEDFLSSVRLGPEDESRAAQLAEEFLAWLRYRGERAARLLSKLSDDAAIDVLHEVLQDEIGRWTGTRRRIRQHGHQLQALLSYDEWSQEFGLAVQVDDRLIGRDVVIDCDEIRIDDFLPYVRLPSEPDMLRAGASIPIAQGIKVRFTPEPAYVLRDEPAVEGLLQVRGGAASKAYRVLVHRDHLAGASDLLRSAGYTGQVEPAASAGWYWFTDVTSIPDSPELRALGLGSLAAPRPSSIELNGGLRVSRDTYLVGFEPDLAVPEGMAVAVDGLPLHVTDPSATPLDTLALSPGVHVVSNDEGDSRSFVTVTHIQEHARGSAMGWRVGTDLEPLRDVDRSAPGITLSGSAFDGKDLRRPLTVRAVPGRECLVISATGEIRQVWPTTEPWVEAIGLDPVTMDLSRALRNLLPDAAFFLMRNPRTGAVDALSLPNDPFASPGKVDSVPRPDLVSALFEEWRWLGDADIQRRSDVLSRAFGRLQATPAATQPVRPTRNIGSLANRADVARGAFERNPYDNILNWLSEREDGTASLEQFRDAWGWSCTRHGFPELVLEERLALYRLERLGYLERDRARRRIGVARPALTALPSANGLLSLTGARPTRLMQRLNDEDDADELIAEAIMSMDVQRRTQLDSRGRPLAPTAIYVSFDPAQSLVVSAGLQRLGVVMQGVGSEAVLDHAPDAQRILSSGMRYTGSPGRHFLRRNTDSEGVVHWWPSQSDLSRGLYEYRLPYGSVFAYRTGFGGDLVATERQLGSWLDAGALGQRKLPRFLMTQRRLYIPRGRSLPLPPMIDRALVLRTGLMPTTMTLSPRRFGHSADYWVYDNVDEATASRVAAHLGQALDEITREDFGL